MTRELEVRNHADLEVGVADTLRQQRLQNDEPEPLWESAITVHRLGLV